MPLSAPRQVSAPKKKMPAFVGLIFVIAAAGLLWMVWNADRLALPGMSEQASKKPKDLSKIESVVNRHLIMTNKKIELERERARLEHLADTPEVGDSILPRARPNTLYGVDHGSDRNELNAVRDLERAPDINISSPDAVIQAEMADKQAIAESERRFREEYARQFIANARAGGYDIELDDNFVVTKVRKIKAAPKSIFDGR